MTAQAVNHRGPRHSGNTSAAGERSLTGAFELKGSDPVGPEPPPCLAIVSHEAIIKAILKDVCADPDEGEQPSGCWSRLVWSGDRWKCEVAGCLPGDGTPP